MNTKKQSVAVLVAAAGWGLAGYLVSALLWPHWRELALAGVLIGAAMGEALLLAKIVSGYRIVAVFAALWAVCLSVPNLVAGPHPYMTADFIGLLLAGGASGLALRVEGMDVPWRTICFVAAGCFFATLIGGVAMLPLLIPTVFLSKNPPNFLLDAFFGVGGCVAGVVAAKTMLSGFSRALAPIGDRASIREAAAPNRQVPGGAVYEAFISYRRTEHDQRWANWLHKHLETWRTPAALVQSHKARPSFLPIFLDRAELTASPDLSEEITRALDASRFLIVICSPRTPHSKWISDEVGHFMKTGRRDKILLLLIEGDLSNALPLPYLREKAATVEVAEQQPEPLAADVRRSHGLRGLEQRRLALLQLIAPILGVKLDDLTRRDQQRRRRSALVIASLACLALAGLAAIISGRLASDRLVRAKGYAQKAAEVVETKPVRGLIIATLALEENLTAGKEPDPGILQSLLTAMSHTSGIPLLGHKSAVRALAFVRDDWLVTGDFDGKLAFWNLKNSPPNATWIDIHTPRILAIDATPDGHWIAAAADGLLTLCDLRVAESIECTPLAHTAGLVWCAAFSPDGNWLAAGGADRRVYVWRKGTDDTFHPGRELQVDLTVVKLVWAPQSDWLAASISYTDLPKERENFNSIVVWKVSDQGPAARIDGPKTPSSLALRFSPDAGLLVSGDEKGTLRFWRVASLGLSSQPYTTVETGSDIMCLGFDHTGSWLVTGHGDGALRIWRRTNTSSPGGDVETMNRYVSGRMDTVYSLAFSRDDLVAVASSFPVIWQGQYIADSKEVHPIGGHEMPVTAVAFSPSGSWLATADFSGAVRLHNPHRAFDGGPEFGSDAPAAASMNGAWIATMEAPPRLYGSGDRFQSSRVLPDFNDRVSLLAFSPDSSMLVALGSRGKSMSWFLGPDGVESSFELTSVGEKRYQESSRCIAFDRSSRMFAIAGDDGYGYVFRREGNQIQQIGRISHTLVRAFDQPTFRPPDPLADQIESMSFSDDGNWLASGSANGSLLVWNLQSAPVGDSLPLADGDRRHSGELGQIQFLLYDRFLATGGADGHVIVRKWSDGKLKVLKDHEAFKGFVMSTARDVDSRWLAAGGSYIPQVGELNYDSRVLLWKVMSYSGDPTSLIGLQGSVNGIAFHPHRDLLAAAGGGKIHFWDLSSGDVAALPLIIDCPEPGLLEFVGGGRYLFASGSHGSRLWSLQGTDLLRRARELVGRNLSQQEWSEEFGQLKYEKTFQDLP